MKRLVLVGAGHAHAGVLRDFASNRPHDLDIVLITPSPAAPYSGMVPGWMAGHYHWDECCIDFPSLCRRAGVALRVDAVTAIDPEHARLTLAEGPAIGYDWLSLNIGPTQDAPVSDSVRIVPLRPLYRLQSPWAALQEAVTRLAAGSRYRVVMVGAGAAGVECILAAQHRLTRLAPQVRFQFTLVTRDEDILAGVAPGAVRRLQAHLASRAIALLHNFSALGEYKGHILAADGHRIAADCALWASTAEAHRWLCDSTLDTDQKGFIRVDRNLRSLSHQNVFAAGDCAQWHRPLPKAGVYAVRMGPVLAHNLRAASAGAKLQQYRPQARHLLLIGTGGANAVASWGALAWEGGWVWRWKQRIDRAFLARHR